MSGAIRTAATRGTCPLGHASSTSLCRSVADVLSAHGPREQVPHITAGFGGFHPTRIYETEWGYGGCTPRDRERQGCRARAPMDGFTASLWGCTPLVAAARLALNSKKPIQMFTKPVSQSQQRQSRIRPTTGRKYRTPGNMQVVVTMHGAIGIDNTGFG